MSIFETPSLEDVSTSFQAMVIKFPVFSDPKPLFSVSSLTFEKFDITQFMELY